MSSAQVVTADQFMAELTDDLPRLTAQHPKGITFRVLAEEYGEPMQRILKVTTHLAAHGIIQIFDDAVPPYILPVGYKPQAARPYQELSDMQRKLFLAFAAVAHPVSSYQIQTSYAQISRISGCSTSGAYSTLDSLEQKGYLTRISHPQQGKANSLIIQLNPDKIAIAQ